MLQTGGNTPRDFLKIGTQGFMDQQELKDTTREGLIGTIVRILKTKRNLDFLLKLDPRELEILVVYLRDWMDREGK